MVLDLLQRDTSLSSQVRNAFNNPTKFNPLQNHDKELRNVLLGAGAGAVTAVVVIPFLLRTIGFSLSGGSRSVKGQDGWVSCLQSIGSAGFGIKGVTIAALAGGALGFYYGSRR